ncbi:MAG: alpha/beta hydrolase [Pseudohongiella sp.]|nr:alpha/beta hydrolase [Pseudohongiella sp.]MDO9518998.1 alpha/beta hydrolase [Pseudohongiella sp.]MDP2128890.1 alpha/beta hydrolase [Pseudohongiella sp.]
MIRQFMNHRANKSLVALFLMAAGQAAFAADVLGVACVSPPPVHCQDGDCAAKTAVRGNITEPVTGREYFLDYPCDLQPGEDLVFVLNIHGAGSIANWQRHYFPAMDYKEKYRLVVATPTAEGSAAMGSGPGVRMWMPQVDDAHLQAITNQVIEAFGQDNIKSFWLAGHSQGGMTSRRLVCTDFFADKVDGMLSLSGGRIGQAPFVANFGPPLADGSPPPARAQATAAETLPSCDFSHIFAIGEYEIESLPDSSPWAERYQCDARSHTQVVDTQAGWLYDTGRSGYAVWGREARPGTSDVYEYANCAENRVVADVVRLDKGHTEGLEPLVTQRILELMVSARGGKLQQAASGGN